MKIAYFFFKAIKLANPPISGAGVQIR